MSAPVTADALAKVLALLPEAALAVSGDGVIRTANERAGDMLGTRCDLLIGRRLSDHSAASPATLAEYLRLCARSNKPVPGAMTLMTSAGQRTVCRCQGALLDARSHASPALLLLRFTPKEAAVNSFITLNLRIEELGREITRRRRAEAAAREQQELLRVTLSSIGDAVIATDAAGHVSFMNAVAERYTGWTQGEAQGRPLADVFAIINENTRAPVENPVARVLREGLTVGLANHTLLIAKDGATRPIDDSGAPIRDAEGHILGVVMVFRDITERRTQERERVEAERRKDEFLAMLAHELRNPLAVLDSGLQVLRGAALRPEENEAAARAGEAMERQVGQLSRLVDDLLDVSRITRGRLELRRTRVALERVLQQAVETVLPAVRSGGLDLKLVAPPEPLIIDADLARLSQVFGNLLSNAAKFTDPGGRILVTSEERAGQALVSVRDTGTGISPDMLGSIFDLFVQADRSLARSQGGLGVGLAIAKLITALHDGTIEAHSEGSGRGSEFIVRLPLAEGGVSQARAAPAMRAAGRRILVVDDNADAAHTLAALLRMHNHDHEVRVALDGSSALQVADAFRPQVVLLDIGLPGMDGYEVARRLRQRPGTGQALVVAVSGYGSEADRRRSREAGFDHHLTKPLDADLLTRLMAEHE